MDGLCSLLHTDIDDTCHLFSSFTKRHHPHSRLENIKYKKLEMKMGSVDGTMISFIYIYIV